MSMKRSVMRMAPHYDNIFSCIGCFFHSKYSPNPSLHIHPQLGNFFIFQQFPSLHIDDAVSSLSAILLNQEYYQLLMRGRKVIDGISVLSASYLIPFKAKAWLDLNDKKNAGVHVDSRDIKKHRNDVLRIAAELPLEDRIELPTMIKGDMLLFTELIQHDSLDLKTLGLPNVKLMDLIELLKAIYC